MLDRLGNMKRRRGKRSSSETRGFKSSVKRKQIKRPVTEMGLPKADPSASDCAYSRPTHPTQRLVNIGCQLQGRKEQPSCGTVPSLGDQCEGKENETRIHLGLDHCRVKRIPGTMDGEDMSTSDRIIFLNDIFPDDDSNEVLPVEQFFGNMEVVQDCPQRPATTSIWGKREHRRRRYYAKEDSDEEEACSDMQSSDRGDT